MKYNSVKAALVVVLMVVFVGCAPTMQGVVDQQTVVYTATLNAASDLHEASIISDDQFLQLVPYRELAGNYLDQMQLAVDEGDSGSFDNMKARLDLILDRMRLILMRSVVELED